MARGGGKVGAGVFLLLLLAFSKQFFGASGGATDAFALCLPSRVAFVYPWLSVYRGASRTLSGGGAGMGRVRGGWGYS